MKSSNQNFQFKKWTPELTNGCVKCREGEEKIGERFGVLEDAEYIILGIEESIGPEANLGNPGAENGFDAFCNSFFNIQSNRFFSGENVAFLGRIELTEAFHEPEYRVAIAELDIFVEQVLSEFLNEKQIPIVIGGGHNNAYPLIKYTSEKLGKKINVVNLDAHADYRKLEGRHSGNPFSYAFSDGFINKYRVLGLQQSYNSEENLKRLDKEGHDYFFMEEFIDDEKKWGEYIKNIKEAIISEKLPTGLELDLDVIQLMPSSASSPFGCSLIQARQYVRSLANIDFVKYFHLPEGAPNNDTERNIVGKTLALLVLDFINAKNNQQN